MTHRKYISTGLILLMFCGISTAQFLNIKMEDDTTVSFGTELVRKITFGPSDMNTILKDGTIHMHDVFTIGKVYFSEELTGIDREYTNEGDNNDLRLNVYPNPVKHWLTLEVQIQAQSNVHIQWISVNGHIVGEEVFYNRSPGLFRHVAQVDMPNGIYLCRVLTDHNMYTAVVKVGR